MPLTRDFIETVRERALEEPEYRRALLRNAAETLLGGDLDLGKALLRQYVNATVGFQRLAQLVGKHEKSLMQMLGPSGNPQARNLFQIIETLQQLEHIELTVDYRSTDPDRPAARI